MLCKLVNERHVYQLDAVDKIGANVESGAVTSVRVQRRFDWRNVTAINTKQFNTLKTKYKSETLKTCCLANTIAAAVITTIIETTVARNISNSAATQQQQQSARRAIPQSKLMLQEFVWRL